MELLDAAIALAVTIAALATTVTVGMEIWVRFFGLKSEAQVALFRKIFDEAVANQVVPVDEGDPSTNPRTLFLQRVLGNPLLPAPSISDSDDTGSLRYAFGKGQAIYEWVSHEHVFRRLLSLDGALSGTRSDIIGRLKRFAARYDEFCSAASADFARRRRFWSIVGGLMLALALNTNGLRIYHEFLKNPELAGAMTARADELERVAVAAEERLENAIEQDDQGGADAGDASDPDDAEAAERVQEFRDAVDRLRGSVENLQATGLPIGWAYTPHCRLVERFTDQRNVCVDEREADYEADDGRQSLVGAENRGGGDERPHGLGRDSLIGHFGSLLALVGTGFLIGLGAPFWFDVAKRLAQVRSFFGGTPPSEQSQSGESVNATAAGAKDAEPLIMRVVDDALAARPSAVRRLLVERREV